MASQSKGKKRSNTVIERPGINWRETSPEGSSLILSVVKEAATLAPIAELKKAACTALLILKTTQVVKENKEAYERLGFDSSGLIIAIWRSFKKAENQEEWLSAEMRDILEDLTHTLESICSFVNEQLSKNKAMRVIFSRADGVKINEYREHLNYAMQKFELQSHMNINDVLIRVMKKNDQISEQIQHRREEEDEVNHALEISARDARDQEIAEKVQKEEWELSKLERLKQVEINLQIEDERWDSDELKKIERETRDRKSELERLREAASVLEANRLKKAEEEEIAQLKRALAAQEDNRRTNRLKKAEEEEIAQLKRTLAAEEDNRRSNKIQARSSRQEDEEVQEDEGWGGKVVIEVASSEEEEEEEEERPVRTKAKRSASGSPNRRPVALEDSTDDDDDFQSMRSSRLGTTRRRLSSASLPEEHVHSMPMRSAKARMTRRNLSSASLRVQETEDDYTDEDDNHELSPPRRSPKGKRNPHTSSGTLPRIVDDLAQFQGFTPMGLGSPRSPMYIPGMNSNPYFPAYGGSLSPPTGPYGYGFGMPGTTHNSGVGNIVTTTISNVGNDNSVKKIYRSRSRQRGD